MRPTSRSADFFVGISSDAFSFVSMPTENLELIRRKISLNFGHKIFEYFQPTARLYDSFVTFFATGKLVKPKKEHDRSQSPPILLVCPFFQKKKLFLPPGWATNNLTKASALTPGQLWIHHSPGRLYFFFLVSTIHSSPSFPDFLLFFFIGFFFLIHSITRHL